MEKSHTIPRFSCVALWVFLLIQSSLHAQQYKWAVSIGGPDLDVGICIDTDHKGNVLVTGYFHDTTDFDPGPEISQLISNGESDVFIQKLDSSGNHLWVKSFGGVNYDLPRSITTDAWGNVYVTGAFRDTVDFDPGPGVSLHTSQGNDDFFIFKLDSAGNYQWAHSFGGSFSDWGKQSFQPHLVMCM